MCWLLLSVSWFLCVYMIVFYSWVRDIWAWCNQPLGQRSRTLCSHRTLYLTGHTFPNEMEYKWPHDFYKLWTVTSWSQKGHYLLWFLQKSFWRKSSDSLFHWPIIFFTCILCLPEYVTSVTSILSVWVRGEYCQKTQDTGRRLELS